MPNDLQRLNIKFYLEDETSVSPEEVFRIFNRWISEPRDEVLIDVADYTHIPNGPQTLLVGHESDYSLDNTDGRMGLRYGRKRPVDGDARQCLRAALSAALNACQRLEEAPEVEGRVQFRGAELQMSVFDRLGSPNSAQTLEALREDLLAVLSEIYGEAQISLTRDEDERQCLTMQIQAQGDFSVASMKQALTA